MVGIDYVNMTPKDKKVNSPTFIKVVAISVLAMLIFTPMAMAI